jgi:hypothetical protein
MMRGGPSLDKSPIVIALIKGSKVTILKVLFSINKAVFTEISGIVEVREPMIIGM